MLAGGVAALMFAGADQALTPSRWMPLRVVSASVVGALAGGFGVSATMLVAVEVPAAAFMLNI